MTTIQLQDVTKIFQPRSTGGSRITPGQALSSVDRAFNQRVSSSAEQSRARGPIIALDHINLSILHGQTTAVIGPSGCGKSTLLRVVAGLDHDYSGQVLYNNQNMRQTPLRERRIGMVFQNYALYPHFEGYGNLAFFFRVRKAPDEETEEKIRFTADLMGFGFKELLKRKPGVLSGGEQQRLAFARAIVRTPEILLLDEPLSHLDAKLRAQTRGEMKRLLKRFEITTLYVTHDQTEAIALADRIAAMNEGRIEQVGTYNWLREDPKNAFVAGFVGIPPMNLFTGWIVEHHLQLGNVRAPLPERIRAHVRPGRNVVLGVRPETAQVLGEDAPLPEGLRLRGMVEAIEPDFAHHSQLLHLQTGKYTYSALGELGISQKIGDVIDLYFPIDKFYFFDADTGERIR